MRRRFINHKDFVSSEECTCETQQLLLAHAKVGALLLYCALKASVQLLHLLFQLNLLICRATVATAATRGCEQVSDAVHVCVCLCCHHNHTPQQHTTLRQLIPPTHSLKCSPDVVVCKLSKRVEIVTHRSAKQRGILQPKQAFVWVVCVRLNALRSRLHRFTSCLDPPPHLFCRPTLTMNRHCKRTCGMTLMTSRTHFRGKAVTSTPSITMLPAPAK